MRLDSALVALLVLFLAPAMVMGQQEVNPELATQWDDFIHYVKVTSRPDLAASFGNAILASDAPAHDLYVLSRGTENVEMLLTRASNMNEAMAEIVLKIRERIKDGYNEYRDDPVAIADAIERLSQSGRAAVNGMERLQESGEYALPQLVQRLCLSDTPATTRVAIVELLPKLGKEAVQPLTEALQTQDPAVLETVASTLGKIGYAHAVPRLREVLDTRDLLPRTQVIVEKAIISCGGEAALAKPLAEICYSVGVDYYNMDPSLLPDSRYEMANVWYWEIPVDTRGNLNHESAVLVFKQVPREIYCDLYAMRMAQLALEHDGDYYPAVSLWLAGDTRREADLPRGQTDAVRTDDQPTAAFYLRAAGAQYAQEVLQRALDDFDSRVAIPAIQALADTAGAKSLLLTTTDGSQPLVEALLYPDRRVRYLAAWAIANALPQEGFTNKDVVINVLNEAIRQNARKMALVIISDEDERNGVKDVLRDAGYEVIDNANPADGIGAAYEVGGVDLVVLGASGPDASIVVPLMRQERLMAATPVLLGRLTTPSLRASAEADGRMVITNGPITKESFDAASRDISALFLSEPMSRNELNMWTIRAAESIRKLGLNDTPVFNINRCRPILALALKIEDDDVQIAAASALAVLSDEAAQGDILSLAMTRFADPDVRVSAFGSVAESVRRFGNNLSSEQAQQVLSIAKGEYSDALREAAAQVLGAMALPSQEIESLILDTPGVVDSTRMLEAIENAQAEE